jgi:hypothetical protein
MKKQEFDRNFKVLENAGDGNCLFLAISQIDHRLNHKELREEVCIFYRELSKDAKIKVDENSLIGKLRTQMVWDNIEYDAITGKPNTNT